MVVTNKERLKGRWGADRMEADAFIMTQLTNNEKALQDVKFIGVLLGLGALAYAEGYHWVAYCVAVFGFLLVLRHEIEFKNRQAGITKLMERNWDIEDKPQDWDDD